MTNPTPPLFPAHDYLEALVGGWPGKNHGLKATDCEELKEHTQLLSLLKVAGEALDIFQKCAYPVATEIDKRGYAWSSAWLDEALPIARAALQKLKTSGVS